MYTKNSFKSKYQLLIIGTEKTVNEYHKTQNHSLIIHKFDDVYENLEDYNRTKKRRVLIVFDDMVADMESNKKLSPIVTELFLRGRKLHISLGFISKSYFRVPKTIRLNATHYFVMKIRNKREL